MVIKGLVCIVKFLGVFVMFKFLGSKFCGRDYLKQCNKVVVKMYIMVRLSLMFGYCGYLVLNCNNLMWCFEYLNVNVF